MMSTRSFFTPSCASIYMSLLQELFRMSMQKGDDGMKAYLKGIKEKLTELTRTETKLKKDVQLAFILNDLSDQYRYLAVSLELQDMESIDMNELFARLIEEEKKFGGSDEKLKMTMMTKGKEKSK